MYLRFFEMKFYADLVISLMLELDKKIKRQFGFSVKCFNRLTDITN